MKLLKQILCIFHLIPILGISQSKTDSIVDYISGIEIVSISSLKHQPIDSICKGFFVQSGRCSDTESGWLIHANEVSNTEDECMIVEYFFHEQELVFILIGSSITEKLDQIYISNSTIIKSTLNLNQSTEYLNNGLNILKEFKRKNKTAPNNVYDS